MSQPRIAYLLPVLLAAAVVAGGCTPEHSDLRQWMAQERKQVVPKVTPLREPVQYVPLAYTGGAAVDPFEHERLTSVLRRDKPRNEGASLIAAEMNRRKDPLEAYPLDTMSMVGTLNNQDDKVALVRVDRLLYQVRVGDHLGQNYGLVTNISENEVTLREVVQDPGGDWIERQATLQLQEKKNG